MARKIRTLSLKKNLDVLIKQIACRWDVNVNLIRPNCLCVYSKLYGPKYNFNDKHRTNTRA